LTLLNVEVLLESQPLKNLAKSIKKFELIFF